MTTDVAIIISMRHLEHHGPRKVCGARVFYQQRPPSRHTLRPHVTRIDVAPKDTVLRSVGEVLAIVYSAVYYLELPSTLLPKRVWACS